MSKSVAKASPVWTPMKSHGPRQICGGPVRSKRPGGQDPAFHHCPRVREGHRHRGGEAIRCGEGPDLLRCAQLSLPHGGHPWSTDPAHQDVADRLLLNRHVRYYGDDIAAVIAEDEVAAAQAVRALKVEYEELPFVLDAQKAMEPDAPQIHEDCPGNVLKHTDIRGATISRPSKSRGSSRSRGGTTPPRFSTATSRTTGALPMRRQAGWWWSPPPRSPTSSAGWWGRPWACPGARYGSSSPTSAAASATSRTRCTSPCAPGSPPRWAAGWCTWSAPGGDLRLQPGPPCHPHPHHLLGPARRHPGARKFEAWSNQGGYASHGHSIVAKGMGAFPQLYPCDNLECDC